MRLKGVTTWSLHRIYLLYQFGRDPCKHIPRTGTTTKSHEQLIVGPRLTRQSFTVTFDTIADEFTILALLEAI